MQNLKTTAQQSSINYLFSYLIPNLCPLKSSHCGNASEKKCFESVGWGRAGNRRIREEIGGGE